MTQKEHPKAARGIVISCFIAFVILIALAVASAATRPETPQPIPFNSNDYDYFALQTASSERDAERRAAIKEEAKQSVTPSEPVEQLAPTENPTDQQVAQDGGELIEGNYYEFLLPEYWKDRVTVVFKKDGGVDIYAKALLGMRLISMEVRDDSSPAAGGDVGNGRYFGKDNGKGQRIELWMTNFPFIVFTENRPGASAPDTEWQTNLLDPTIARELVDLQTLGAVNADQIIQSAQAGGDEFETQDAWANAVNVIIPTIVVR